MSISVSRVEYHSLHQFDRADCQLIDNYFPSQATGDGSSVHYISRDHIDEAEKQAIEDEAEHEENKATTVTVKVVRGKLIKEKKKSKVGPRGETDPSYSFIPNKERRQRVLADLLQMLDDIDEDGADIAIYW